MDTLLTLLVGFAGGLAASIFGGFFGAAGGDLWAALKRRLGPPAPKAVPFDWKPEGDALEGLKWVRSFEVEKAELDRGYRIFLDSADGRPVYRINRLVRDYLMVVPASPELAKPTSDEARSPSA